MKRFFLISIRLNPSAGVKIVVFRCKPQFEIIKLNTGLNSRHPKQKLLMDNGLDEI